MHYDIFDDLHRNDIHDTLFFFHFPLLLLFPLLFFIFNNVPCD
jgi:hypothetical protein